VLVKARPYSQEQEAEEWNFQKVCGYLASGVFNRRVGVNGQIWIYGRYYAVGRAYAKRWVSLRFAAETQEWVIEDEPGKEVKRHRSKEITAAKVQALQVTQRQKKKSKQGA